MYSRPIPGDVPTICAARGAVAQSLRCRSTGRRTDSAACCSRHAEGDQAEKRTPPTKRSGTPANDSRSGEEGFRDGGVRAGSSGRGRGDDWCVQKEVTITGGATSSWCWGEGHIRGRDGRQRARCANEINQWWRGGRVPRRRGIGPCCMFDARVSHLREDIGKKRAMIIGQEAAR